MKPSPITIFAPLLLGVVGLSVSAHSATRPTSRIAVTQVALLDFRIAIVRNGSSEGLSISEAEETAAIKDLADNGPRARADHRWFAVDPKATISPDVLVGQRDSQRYILLSNARDATLLADRDAPRTWSLRGIYQVESPVEDQTQIDVEFDQAGREQFARLTESHIHQDLAELVNDQVLAAPRIYARVDGSCVIAASKDQFTSENLDELVRALRRGMMAAAIPPTSRPQNDFEQLAAEQIQIDEELAATLATVTDEVSATAAIKKIDGYAERIGKIKARCNKLGQPAEEVLKALKSKYDQRLDAISTELDLQRKRIERQEPLNRILRDPLDRLENAGK